jgi:hypothetical protein
MTWKTVRLELARCASFPNGSPSRAYLLRVPLDENAEIDESALAQRPSLATSRRFWASDPDQFGHVERADGQLLLRFTTPAGERVARIAARPFHLNGEIAVEEPDGTQSWFRIASITNNSRPSRP